MKISKNYFKSLAKTAVFSAALAVVLSACSKSNVDYPQITAGQVALYHASTNAPELSIYTNGSKANLTDFTYSKGFDYLNAVPGKIEFGITKTTDQVAIAKKVVTVEASKSYSLFVADSLQTSVLVYTTDDLAAPAADKAKVRFINLSADAGSLDLNINGQPTVLFAKQDFKVASPYVAVDPNASYTLEVKATGTATVLASLPATKIEKGKIYTVYLRGLKSAAAPNNLVVGVITNR